MSEYLGRPRVTVLFTLDLGCRRQSVRVAIKKGGGRFRKKTIDKVLFIIVQKTSTTSSTCYNAFLLLLSIPEF